MVTNSHFIKFTGLKLTLAHLQIWEIHIHVVTLGKVSKFFLGLMKLSSTTRGRSRTAARPRVDLFVIIVNGWKLLTIITKSSILDVTAVLDPPLLHQISINLI